MTATPDPVSSARIGPGAATDGARVLVVVPAWNAAVHLPAALGSLLAQTLQDWVCVVVDDGSTDGTAAVVTSCPDPRVVLVQQENAGVAAARNAALTHPAGAGCELVAFLDADDLLLPDALERLAAALDASPGTVGAYGTAEYVDGDGAPFAPGLHPSRQRDRRRARGPDLAAVPPGHDRTTFAMLAVSGPIWPSSVAMLRLHVVRSVGGFATDLAQCEDWDLYIRASRSGDFVFLDRQVAWYRRHDANLTNDLGQSARLAHVVRCRAWGDPDNTARQQLTAARAWRALQHRRVVHCARVVVASARSGGPGAASAAVRVLAVELVQLLRVRPPTGPTGTPAGTPVTVLAYRTVPAVEP